jgi:hypothetical protein
LTYRVRYTLAAKHDLVELYAFLLKRDIKAARNARDTMTRSIDFYGIFPSPAVKRQRQCQPG